MAKGYRIARVDVTNMDGYKPYRVAIQPIFKKLGARYLTRGGRSENVERQNRSRNVSVELPDYDSSGLLTLAGLPESKENMLVRGRRRYRQRGRLRRAAVVMSCTAVRRARSPANGGSDLQRSPRYIGRNSLGDL